ncbi:MAG TPA: hypothetical protein VEO73_00280 [Gemmatimonadales bacterium]|nr:hypothetical protein [Gemmatimonadales bacterium]
MRRRRVLSLALVVDALLATALVSQSETSVVALLPGSTRSAGLGGAGAALVGDAGAIFANPAGLATVRHVAVEGSYEPYLAGTVFSTAAIAVRLGRITWGAGAQALDYGSEPIIVPDSSTGGRRGSPTGGTFSAADLLAVSSVVYRHGLIALGVSGKYARQQIGGYAADAWAGDAGLAIAVFDIFAVGASVQNIGGDFGNGARLPRRTRVGVTLNYVDPEGTMRLLSTLEGQWTPGRPAVLVQGVEGGVVTGGVGLVGRLGYATRSPTSDASRFTVGGGIELGRLHFDYAYQGFDVLGGGTHRVGLRWTP